MEEETKELTSERPETVLDEAEKAELSLKERKQRFVDVFCDEVYNGLDPYEAAKVAKQASNLTGSPFHIIKGLTADIIENSRTRLVMVLPKMNKKLDYVSDNPEDPGSKRILETVTLVMDRAGLDKKETTEVQLKLPDGIAILPSKNYIKE